MNETERRTGQTPFQAIYDSFLNLVTDDMYMEWGEEETYADIKNIFLAAISNFQFQDLNCMIMRWLNCKQTGINKLLVINLISFY